MFSLLKQPARDNYRNNHIPTTHNVGIKRVWNSFLRSISLVVSGKEHPAAAAADNPLSSSVDPHPASSRHRRTQSISVPSSTRVSQRFPPTELEQLAWDVRAEKRLWKEAVERAKANPVDSPQYCAKSVLESHVMPEARGSKYPFDIENSLTPGSESGLSSTVKAAILPSVAEEEEDGSEFRSGASVDTNTDMPAHSSAPSLRKVVAHSDLRNACDFATSMFDSRRAEPKNHAIANVIDSVWIPDSHSYPSSIGSAAAHLLELSGLPNVSSTESPSNADLSCPAASTTATTSNEHSSSADSHLAAAVSLTSHQVQEPLELEEHVLNLTFQLDQALAEIYDLGAQLLDTEEALRRAATEHADQTDVLLRQVGQLREDLQHSCRDQRRLAHENKVLREIVHSYSLNVGNFELKRSAHTLSERLTWSLKPQSLEFDGESAMSSAVATPQLSCGSTSLPSTPLRQQVPSITVYNADDQLDDLEVDLGDVKQISRLFDSPPSSGDRLTEERLSMLGRDPNPNEPIMDVSLATEPQHYGPISGEDDAVNQCETVRRVAV